jgi:hypothetical protein
MSKIITDPSVITQLAQNIGNFTEDIKTTVPVSTLIELPGGIRLQNGEFAKTAQVRELTGADEEAIAVIDNAGAKLNVILQRGVVKLGETVAGPLELDSLFAGDRDALLLAIRRVTFGPTELLNITCSGCLTAQTTEINLLDDIKVKSFSEEAYTKTFTVDTKLGKLVVAYPNGVTQRKVAEAANKTTAELVTVVLAGCILSLNGEPVMGNSVALQLGLQDRANIVDLLSDGAPGPRLGEVKKTCGACGKDIIIPLSLHALFRIW